MMDLYQLRYFLEAARERHFGRAADALAVSPPAVSRAIALLERSVGRPLFRRVGRRVELTAAGAALKARAERVFDEVAAAEREVREGAADGELRLGVREMVLHHLLPPVLEDLARRRPGLTLAFHELEPGDMAAALLKDRLELGFAYEPLALDGLSCVRLGRMTSGVYASPALLRRAGRPRTPAETLALPFVAPRRFGAPDGAPGADGFPDARLKRAIRYKAELLETHRLLAVRGLCAAVLPDGVAAPEVRAGRLVRLPGPPLGRELYAFRREGRPLPDPAEELIAGARRELRGW